MSNQRLKIGVAHPRLDRGGSEARVMWAIEALKVDYDIDLITAGAVDLDSLNKFYGTSLRPDDFKIHRAPFSFLFANIQGGDALRGAYFQRHCQHVAPDYDILISAYNPLDFGAPAIHFIADFCWDEDVRTRLHPPPPGIRGHFHGNSSYRRAYMSIVRSISKPSGRNLFGSDDLIVANSRWTAGIIAAKYGTEARVLYPPVVSDFPKIPMEDREEGFVCIGRIAPEKRIERIIEILRLVRRKGHSVHLHIIGSTGNSTYGRFVEDISRNEHDWVKLEGLRAGEEKKSLLSRHRFGLHACQGEAFGIAVADMVKAGCITFCPSEGGQAEIVDHPSLIYSSIDDAVKKIDYVLRNEKMQAGLSAHLMQQAEKFSAVGFMERTRAVVREFLQGRFQ